jgi:orotidine-5'-phosphate decarboxylase
VHAFGGSDMMRRTAAAVSDVAEAEGLTRPAIIAVTVLTSADSDTLAEVGNTFSAEKQVRNLSLLAATCGMDGVVASPREIALVRDSVKQADFLVVTPGVRPSGSEVNDQKRIMTPGEAIAAGADYLVIGRPITEAKDPALAAERIIAEMATKAS